METPGACGPPIVVSKAVAHTMDCRAFGPGHKHSIACGLFGPPHQHPEHFQLVYVCSATGSVRIGSHWHSVAPKDLYIVKPNQVHQSEAEPDTIWSLWDIRFRLTEPDALPIRAESLPDISARVGDLPLQETLARLIDEYTLQHAGWEWVCSYLVAETILRIHRLHQEERVGEGNSYPAGLHADDVRRAQSYIHFHYHEALTVADLARMAGMSPSRFATAFRESAGRPPIDYLIEVRLDRAADLLREGRYTVSQVAAMTGFGSVHYFSRLFRQRRGERPSALMRT